MSPEFSITADLLGICGTLFYIKHLLRSYVSQSGDPQFVGRGRLTRSKTQESPIVPEGMVNVSACRDSHPL